MSRSELTRKSFHLKELKIWEKPIEIYAAKWACTDIYSYTVQLFRKNQILGLVVCFQSAKIWHERYTDLKISSISHDSFLSLLKELVIDVRHFCAQSVTLNFFCELSHKPLRLQFKWKSSEHSITEAKLYLPMKRK